MHATWLTHVYFMTRLKKKTGGGNSAVTNRIQREPHGKPLIFRHEIPRTRQRSRWFFFVFWNYFFVCLMYTHYITCLSISNENTCLLDTHEQTHNKHTSNTYVTHMHVISHFFCNANVSHDALLRQIFEWVMLHGVLFGNAYVRLTNESWHTSRDWVVSLVCTSHGTYKCIHTMSHGTHMNAFKGWTKKT